MMEIYIFFKFSMESLTNHTKMFLIEVQSLKRQLVLKLFSSKNQNFTMRFFIAYRGTIVIIYSSKIKSLASYICIT